MIVSFLTLFLGLTWGEQKVEVAVRSDVAVVELQLDGFVAGRLGPALFRTTVDFGPDLLPHELVAVAFDAAGREIGTARQWINLPRPKAEASFVIESPSRDGPRIAHLTWHCAGVDLPFKRDVTFDGTPLAAPHPSRIELPAYDAARVHILRADLDFGRATATAVAFVGGQEKDQTGAQLTAVPVRVTCGGPLPPPAAMSGWFRVDGKPVRVEAAEEGPADVVFVVDESAERDLRRIGKRRSSESRIGVAPDLRLYVGIPVARIYDQPGYHYKVFPSDGPLGDADGELPLLLATRVARFVAKGGVKDSLTLAVAAAASRAMQENRRRAIVLVLGPSPRISGDLQPGQVESYLASLWIPLVVLRVSEGAHDSPWGAAVDVSTRRLFREALSRLGAELDRQRIVWLDAPALPQSISLSAESAGIELVR